MSPEKGISSLGRLKHIRCCFRRSVWRAGQKHHKAVTVCKRSTVVHAHFHIFMACINVVMTDSRGQMRKNARVFMQTIESMKTRELVCDASVWLRAHTPLYHRTPDLRGPSHAEADDADRLYNRT